MEITIALIASGSALVGALIGAGASLFGLHKQFQRDDKMERERRASDILIAVEDCGYVLITGIGKQIVSDQEQVYEHIEKGESYDQKAAKERHQRIIEYIRQAADDAQKQLNRQRALARLFINQETRNKIHAFSKLLIIVTGELIENYKKNLLSRATAEQMPSKPIYDQALTEIYESLERYVDGKESRNS